MIFDLKQPPHSFTILPRRGLPVQELPFTFGQRRAEESTTSWCNEAQISALSASKPKERPWPEQQNRPQAGPHRCIGVRHGGPPCN
jgi:hypothetical protein